MSLQGSWYRVFANEKPSESGTVDRGSSSTTGLEVEVGEDPVSATLDFEICECELRICAAIQPTYGQICFRLTKECHRSW